MIDTKFLIMASGPSVQWKGPRSRHLLPIADEPLVMRTARLCTEFEYLPTIVTDVPEVQRAVKRYFDPGPNKWIYDTIKNTQELWAERTIILAGDVLFYDQTINTFLRYERTCIWAGAYGILALTFAPDMPRQRILRYLDRAWTEAESRGHGELQILHQLGLMTNYHYLDIARMYDFDTVEVYQKCLDECPWVAGSQGAAYLEPLVEKEEPEEPAL